MTKGEKNLCRWAVIKFGRLNSAALGTGSRRQSRRTVRLSSRHALDEPAYQHRCRDDAEAAQGDHYEAF